MSICRWFFVSAFVLVSLTVFPMSTALARATCDEARAMAESAAQYLEKHGAERAIRAFKGPDYLDGELYVFLFNKEGTIIMHRIHPEIVGRYGLDSKDITGALY